MTTLILCITWLLIAALTGYLVNKWLDLQHSLNTLYTKEHIEKLLAPHQTHVESLGTQVMDQRGEIEALKMQLQILSTQNAFKRN